MLSMHRLKYSRHLCNTLRELVVRWLTKECLCTPSADLPRHPFSLVTENGNLDASLLEALDLQ